MQWYSEERVNNEVAVSVVEEADLSDSFDRLLLYGEDEGTLPHLYENESGFNRHEGSMAAVAPGHVLRNGTSRRIVQLI